jgi:hypothetical protein
MLRNNFESVWTATMLLGWKHGDVYRGKPVLDIDDLIDPRYCDNLKRFIIERPQEWSTVVNSALYQEAIKQQKANSFAVAVAVREPRRWYSSCLRIHKESPDFLIHGVSPREAAEVWNRCHHQWASSLGDRGVFVDTDVLRTNPGDTIVKIGKELRLKPVKILRTPNEYIHPASQEELYELLDPFRKYPVLSREFTDAGHVDESVLDDFLRLLDHDLLQTLGFTSHLGSASARV